MKKVTHKELDEVFQQEGQILSDDFTKRLLETLRYYDNMSGDKFTAPNLSQATNSFIVDELGLMRQEIKPRQTYEQVLSRNLKNQADQGLIQIEDAQTKQMRAVTTADIFAIGGEQYVGTFKYVEKWISDGDAIKAYCDNPDDWIARNGRNATLADFQKLSQYWEIRTTPAPVKGE